MVKFLMAATSAVKLEMGNVRKGIFRWCFMFMIDIWFCVRKYHIIFNFVLIFSDYLARVVFGFTFIN